MKLTDTDDRDAPEPISAVSTPRSGASTGKPPPKAGSVLWTDVGLVTLSVIWGVNFSVIKVALREFEPLAFNALRFPLAALTLFVILRLRGPIPLPHRRDCTRIVLLGLLANLFYQFLFIFGIDHTLAGNASLVLATTPVWTLILATVLGQERHSIVVWLGVVATLGGMMLVVVGGGAAVGMGAGLPVGDLLLVAAAITWSAYTVGAQGLTRRYGALPVTAWTLWIGSVGLVAAGVGPVLEMDLSAVSPLAWASMAYAGILAIAIAYLLWNHGVEHIGGPRTAAFSNLVPIVALGTAALWIGERPSPLQITGATVIIGGVWLARAAGQRERSYQPGRSACPSPWTRIPGEGDDGPRGTRTR